MNFCVQISVNRGFLFSCTANSWIFLSKQSSVSFLVGIQWCDITHLVMQIPIPTMEPFVGLMVPDPSSVLVSQENPYSTGPFGISPWSTNQSLTRSSMGGMQEPSLCTLRWLWCWFYTLNPSFAQINKPLGLVDVLSLPSLKTSTKVYDNPSCNPNQWLRYLCTFVTVLLYNFLNYLKCLPILPWN